MTKHSRFSLCLASVFFSLSLSAIYMDFSIRFVNAISLGALLFSVSEIICSINNRRVYRKSVGNVIFDDECTDRSALVLKYIDEINKERVSIDKSQKTILYFISLSIKTLSFASIIIYPQTNHFEFLNESTRFSCFCTIISFGIMFYLYYLEEERYNTDLLNDYNSLLKCYDIVINERNLVTQRAIDAAERACDVAERACDVAEREIGSRECAGKTKANGKKFSILSKKTDK